MTSYSCRAVDASFLASAPERHVLDVELACTPAQLFEIFEEPESWTRWVPGIRRVEWTTPSPRGVGATRQVTLLGGAQIVEKFTVWEPGRALAFHVLEANQPIWTAFAESYALTPTPSGGCRLTWTVAYEPRDGFARVHPFVRPAMRAALKGFLLLLRRYIARRVRAEQRVAQAA